MMFPKHKNIRLKGTALKNLVKQVYEREKGHCLVCGKYLDFGYKPHHVKQASSKTDELNNMVLLCNECHYQVHHGEVKKYRKLIKDRMKERGISEQ